MYNKLALICFVMSAILSLPVISSRSESEEVTRLIEIPPTLLTSSDPNYIFVDFNEVFFGKLKIVTNDLSMNQNLTIRLGEDCSNGVRINTLSPSTQKAHQYDNIDKNNNKLSLSFFLSVACSESTCLHLLRV